MIPGDRDAVAPLPTGVRRTRILGLVQRHEFASVADLSAAFGVSEVTIRNDLDVLAQEGRLERVRGGAVHRADSGREAPFEQELGARHAEKAAIGVAGARLVESGQTVILDAGTTAAAVARALVARADLDDVTVFTNGLRVAMALEPAIPRFAVIVTGGTLRRLQHSLTNPLGTAVLDQVHAHLGFLECEGVDPQAGVTGINVAEAEVKRLMMRAARRRILVADGSKIGQISLVHLYGLDDVDLLVSDPTAGPEVVDALRDRALEVLIAEPSVPTDPSSPVSTEG